MSWIDWLAIILLSISAIAMVKEVTKLIVKSFKKKDKPADMIMPTYQNYYTALEMRRMKNDKRKRASQKRWRKYGL